MVLKSALDVKIEKKIPKKNTEGLIVKCTTDDNCGGTA